MESLLFKYLKDKATNDETKDKLIYSEKKHIKCTYETLYEMVLKKMELFKTMDWQNPYLLAVNDIESVSSLIALLAIGQSPIILNGINALINQTISSDYIEMNKRFCEREHVINDHPNGNFYIMNLINAVEDIKKSEVINKPDGGMIGIFSSGTLSNPKVIYMDEKKLIDKVFESNYVNEKRTIYNTAPLSTISGLYTNVFVPIVSNNTSAIFSNKFKPLFATIATDVYLPRNYADSFNNNEPVTSERIKRIFTYGEQNSKELYNFIRTKIGNLPDSVFVNVYGTTECAGLVSEIEEKDMKELHLYYLDINNDTIIYSYDDQTLYKKVGNTVTILDENEKKKFSQDNITKYLPCGFVSDKIKIRNNKCVGDCLTNDLNTGDIIAIIDDKFYVIGRKKDIDKNPYLANYDSQLCSQSGKICATFTDDNNDLCVAIRCSLESEDNLLKDQTTTFRRLLTDAPKIRKLIKDNYPTIKKTIFLPDYAFKLSAGIKKSNRKELNKYLKLGETINERIDHYDEIIKRIICKNFEVHLGYIPNFKILEDHNILLSKKDIKLENIVDLLNAIDIVMIVEENDYYKLFYNDAFFFNELSLRDSYIPNNYEDIYDEGKIYYYRECAKHNLLIESLAADNNIAYLNINDPNLEIYKTMRETYVFFLEGSNKDGDVILIPYYYIDLQEGYQFEGQEDTIHEKERLENGKKALEIIKDYPDYDFDEFELYIPLPISLLNDQCNILYDVINLTDKTNTNNNLKDYAHQLIKNTYFLNVDSLLYGMYNKFFLNSKMTKILK